MAKPKLTGMSRGAELLFKWRGDRKQEDVLALLGDMDVATLSRFENGVRKPSARLCFEVEGWTRGAVPAKSWFDAPVTKRGHEIDAGLAAKSAPLAKAG